MGALRSAAASSGPGVPPLRPALHPELFDTLAVRTVKREDYALTVRITRTGHAITWQTKTAHLTEVTARADWPLPERRARPEAPRPRRTLRHLPCGPALCYQTSFQVEILPQEIFFHVHGRNLRDGAKRGLLHNFQPNHRLALAPLGFVTVEAWSGNLLLSSFHTFPDENTVVKTQSLIERKR